MKIKICGIQREEDVKYLNSTMPDYAGFVFAKSKRQVTISEAKHLRQLLNPDIQTVGVFVNEDVEFVVSCAAQRVIEIIQLHGDEDEQYIQELKKKTDVPIIKAVRAKDEDVIRDADKLSCDYLLLDTYQENVYGGTGKTFLWDLIPDDLSHPFILAGGLSQSNINDAVSQVACIGVDVSGGVETDGMKDEEKIKHMIAAVRGCK